MGEERGLTLGELIAQLEAARAIAGDDASILVGSSPTYSSNLNQSVHGVVSAGRNSDGSGWLWLNYWRR